MPDPLRAARARAERVRFVDDSSRRGLAAPASTSGVRRRLAQDALQISAEVTPGLHAIVRNAESLLRLPSESLLVFVEASPHIQATCHREGPTQCTVVLSSTLVELLDADELGFVLGHELGHFLLDHGITELATSDAQIEVFMQMRAQEVSADRVGLLACGSLDIAVRALVKTLSGLSSRHVRFDVRALLAQLRSPDVGPAIGQFMSTHPSGLVRCRALMWFSPSLLDDNQSPLPTDRLREIDELVRLDLRRFVDGPAMERLLQLETDLALWLAAKGIAADGVFDLGEQAGFADEFGEDTLRSLKGFLSTHSATEARAAIDERVTAARHRLSEAAPVGFDAAMTRIDARLGNRFGTDSTAK